MWRGKGLICLSKPSGMSDEPIALVFFHYPVNIYAMAAAGNDLQQLEQHVKKLNER